ncbi:hypothetical protein AXG93_2931s1280 [Marchantia polymorpha subsp. ruderalis]|uniref:Uncharacterized protein n=1 Tax=Marchantia polymorpha subsp. ruderalis TaxID=1480154 RepID=A0A176VXK4_MARPO|nr:hypothetical protein AXG93_2931s1280 [Marchantia polymorpha subsp. ruderalis]
MTKVKARRLILEADSSTESSVDASQGCHTLEEEAELEVETVVREKDGPLEKDIQTSEKRYSAGMKRRATRKEKGKNIMTDEGTQERNQVPLAEAKVATTNVVVEKEKQLRETEAKYEVLRRRLAEDVEMCRSSEKTCESLRADIEVTICATVDLRDRLEASRVTFNEESRRVYELSEDLEKKDQVHATELAAKEKALRECEVARTPDMELIEVLEAKCNEMRSQRLLAKDQLNEMEVNL